MRSQTKILIQLFVFLSIFKVSYANWAEAMFAERRHDFGSVAIGVDASYSFKFQNIYKQDVEISEIRSSCGCTNYSVTKTRLKTGETSEVIAKLNTSGQFVKDKSATITVVFSKPFFQEAQLQVTSYIRPDVVISPGIAEFGSIRQGKSVTKQLTMQYAGRNDWKLLKIEKNSQNIRVQAALKERANGRVTYDIFVTLKEETPPGYVQDMVRFITNDPNPDASSIILPIHGYVSSPLSVRPSPLIIGNLNPGETITKNIVIRGETPFQISGIHSQDSRFKFHTSKQANKIHVVPISFRADEKTGLVESVVTVATNMDSQKQMDLLIQGNIITAMQDQFPRQIMADYPSPLLTEETKLPHSRTKEDNVFDSSETENEIHQNQSIALHDTPTDEVVYIARRNDNPPSPPNAVSGESNMTLITVSTPQALKKTTNSVVDVGKETNTVSTLPETPRIVEDIFTVEENSVLNPPSSSIAALTKEPENRNIAQTKMNVTETKATNEGPVFTENLFQEITPAAKVEKQEVVAASTLKFVTPKLVQEQEKASAIASSTSTDLFTDGVPSDPLMAKTKAVPPVPGMNLTKTMSSSFSPLSQESPVIPHLIIPKLSLDETASEKPTENLTENVNHSLAVQPLTEMPQIGSSNNEPPALKSKPVLVPFSSPLGKQAINTLSSQEGDFSSVIETSKTMSFPMENQSLRQPLNQHSGQGKPKIIEPRTTKTETSFTMPAAPLISKTPLPEKRSLQQPTRQSSDPVANKPVLIQPGAIPMASSVGNQQNNVVPPPPRLR